MNSLNSFLTSAFVDPSHAWGAHGEGLKLKGCCKDGEYVGAMSMKEAGGSGDPIVGSLVIQAGGRGIRTRNLEVGGRGHKKKESRGVLGG